MSLKIDSQALAAFFGTKSKLDALIQKYRDALEEHKSTINKAAPLTHPLIERIVREGDGTYEVIELPADPTVDYAAEERNRVKIEPTLEAALSFIDQQGAARQELYNRRWQRQEYGVTWNGYRFSGDLYTAMDLMAELRASMATGDVPVVTRTADGEYIELSKADMQQVLDAIVMLTRQTYQNERRLSEAIDAATTSAALKAVDLGSGW